MGNVIFGKLFVKYCIIYSIHMNIQFRFQYYRRLGCMKSLTEKSGDFMEHQRKIWDTISFRSSRPLLLTGVGIFTPIGAQSIICVDARPIEEPLRPLDVKTRLESEYGDPDESTITVFSKVINNYGKTMFEGRNFI